MPKGEIVGIFDDDVVIVIDGHTLALRLPVFVPTGIMYYSLQTIGVLQKVFTDLKRYEDPKRHEDFKQFEDPKAVQRNKVIVIIFLSLNFVKLVIGKMCEPVIG